MKKSVIVLMALLILVSSAALAQQHEKPPMVLMQVKKKGKPDSLVVKVGNSRIAVIIRDTADLEALRHFDIQELVDDMIDAAFEGDTSALRRSGEYMKEVQERLMDAHADVLREQEAVIQEAEEMARRRRDRGDQDEFRERERELHIRLRELADRERELLEKNRRSWDDFRKEDWKDLLRKAIQLEKDRFRSKDENGEEFDREDLEYAGGDHQKTTYQSFNIDFGLNNYLSGGRFVDAGNPPYTLRHLGSWYIGIHTVYRTRLAQKFFIEWGLGGSIYNFKFQKDSLRIIRDAAGIQFIDDTRDADFRKSKLTAGYLQASFVPVLDLGANKYKPGLLDGRGGRSFRIGAGPYLGYRILSYAKQYYRIEGDKKNERNHDNFYLNNVRYGIRTQIGFRDTDFFFCYDLNELFSAGRGPRLHAFSFGISF